MAQLLVTGATGYIGGRLVLRLLEDGHAVRALVRDADRVRGRPGWARVETVEGDALDSATWPVALDGIEAAYYLIHSMTSPGDFVGRDVQAARLFAGAARSAGLGHVIYLGGLGDPAARLSSHLRSRHQVGDALREAGVPVTEFRASVVIGSGSASFEMLRYLVEGLPVLPCPGWASHRVQPIGIEDVLDYLVGSLTCPESRGAVVEIGGRDVLSYDELLLTYARIRGLRRIIISPPLMHPAVCASIVDLFTPIPRRLAQSLIESLRYDTVVRDDNARRLFPAVHALGAAAALAEAVDYAEQGRTETAWSDAAGPEEPLPAGMHLSTREGLLFERVGVDVEAGVDSVWAALRTLGRPQQGRTPGWLWWFHGKINSLSGGVGALRGRRHPTELRIGDVIDYWRVDDLDPPKRLRLRAELTEPGSSWLEFSLAPIEPGRTRLVETTIFAPHGLPGILYWHALVPLRRLFFDSLAQLIRRRAEGKDSA
jgi:uncharacterized protein YbjT (DUF2867 family)